MDSSKDNQYNLEPVCYCVNCLSLGVKQLKGSPVESCVECGNTEFAETDIHSWQTLYEKTYGKNFLTGKLVTEDAE